MDDTISRQAAIDVIDNFNCFEFRADQIALETKIRNLPSAEPEIIRCRECKFASGDNRICMKFDHSPIGELDFCSWAEKKEDAESRWIPVTEKLPEEDKDVLCKTLAGVIFVASYGKLHR
ncbi:hypothetical protein [Methanobrevibacter sp.]|uniref:hypothetical protein n=1 Tax=Methanobrevibacter sp. TaxID=66852 RepID=UPI00386AE81C